MAEELLTSTVFEQMLDDACPTLELDQGYNCYRFETICMGWLVEAKREDETWTIRAVKAYNR